MPAIIKTTGSSSTQVQLPVCPWTLGGAVAVSSVVRSLQAAIETDEMWLQLQTDLKEAIGSVWTVMGYPEPCRGAGYNNEMHLFVPPETTPPLSREDDWAVDLSIAPALSVCPGPYNSCGCATCCAEGVRGSRTNAKIRTMFCWQTRQAGTSHFLPLASWFLLSHLHSIIQFQLPSSPRAILSL